MTKIMPDFSAYCKQDNVPSYNNLDGRYPIKLPTQIREEPQEVDRMSPDTMRLTWEAAKQVLQAQRDMASQGTALLVGVTLAVLVLAGLFNFFHNSFNPIYSFVYIFLILSCYAD